MCRYGWRARLTAWTGWALCRARTNIVPKPRVSAPDAGLADTYLASPAQPRIRIGLGTTVAWVLPAERPETCSRPNVCPPPALCVRARPAESSGCGRGRRACGRAAQPPSRPQTHPRIPRLRRLAARACHAPAPAADSRSDFGVAFPRATGRFCEKKMRDCLGLRLKAVRLKAGQVL